MKRRIAFAIVAALALVVGAMSSALTTVDAANAKVWLSSSTASPRKTITIYGSGLPARKSVTISFNGKSIATVKSSQQGGFSKQWTVPSTTRSGAYVIRTTTGKVSAETTLQVGSAAPAPAPAAPTPTPAPVTPTPTPVVTPEAPAAAPERTTCSTTLQSLVDAAVPGSVVAVPGCVYRETVTINKPITLKAEPGAEIRGSDDWSTGWVSSGSLWTRGTVPTFNTDRVLPCAPNSQRCLWAEQVFLDGQPLVQVASNPQSGQFAVTPDRQVTIADNPRGRLVEVSVRQFWIVGQADNVTIEGFTMKHAATPPQHGAISNTFRSGWTIQNNVLSDAHGAVVSLALGTDLKLLNNDISRGGSLGVHGWAGTNTVVQGNRIHHNNTEQFDWAWEAGGVKMADMQGLTIIGNEVFNNYGIGIWCDVNCRNSTIASNRVHHNNNTGIYYEVSRDAVISSNTVWENGHADPSGGIGAGIGLTNSVNVEVANNVVVWNADGIAVMAWERSDSPAALVGLYVHDNTIALSRQGEGDYALGWLQWHPYRMEAADSNNRGANNRYFHPNPPADTKPFQWANGANFKYGDLAGFNGTNGEEAGSYLTVDQLSQILGQANVPVAPDIR